MPSAREVGCDYHSESDQAGDDDPRPPPVGRAVTRWRAKDGQHESKAAEDPNDRCGGLEHARHPARYDAVMFGSYAEPPDAGAKPDRAASSSPNMTAIASIPNHHPPSSLRSPVAIHTTEWDNCTRTAMGA